MKRIIALALALWGLWLGTALGENVQVCGLTLDAAAAEADFSAGKQSARGLEEGLKKLPGLQRAALGQTPLKAAELLRLKAAYPQVEFTYALKMYGQWTAWDAEALSTDMTINNIDLLREYLRCLPRLKKFTAYGTSLSRENYEGLLAEFPNVDFHVTLSLYGHRVATDATAFSTLHTPDDAPHKDFSALVYCKNLRALDLGHNWIFDIDWIEPLKELRVLILSDNRITDISPLADKPLEYLEMFNNRVKDISCLEGKETLLDLNLCNTHVGDLSVLYTLPNLKRVWMGDIDELTKDTVNAYLAEKGDTLEAYNFTTKYPTEGGWRTHARYEIIKAMFFAGEYISFDTQLDDSQKIYLRKDHKY